MYVPLLLGSMDTDNYAVWLTLTSLVSWIALFDIGLGNGLRNRLSETLAKNDITQSKKYISTAYCGVIIVAMFLFISFFDCKSFYGLGTNTEHRHNSCRKLIVVGRNCIL